jgi:hypothetical protein
MTFEQGAADLIRAFSGYSWPIATVIVVVVLRTPLAKAIAAIAARVSRIGVKTAGGTEAFVELKQAEEVATDRSKVLDVIREQIEKLSSQ